MADYGKGKYLIFSHCGVEGFAVYRYESKEQLLNAIQYNVGSSFIIAEELELEIINKRG